MKPPTAAFRAVAARIMADYPNYRKADGPDGEQQRLIMELWAIKPNVQHIAEVTGLKVYHVRCRILGRSNVTKW